MMMSDPNLAHHLSRMAEYASNSVYYHEEQGWNFAKMNDAMERIRAYDKQ